MDEGLPFLGDGLRRGVGDAVLGVFVDEGAADGGSGVREKVKGREQALVGVSAGRTLGEGKKGGGVRRTKQNFGRRPAVVLP